MSAARIVQVSAIGHCCGKEALNQNIVSLVGDTVCERIKTLIEREILEI